MDGQVTLQIADCGLRPSRVPSSGLSFVFQHLQLHTAFSSSVAIFFFLFFFSLALPAIQPFFLPFQNCVESPDSRLPDLSPSPPPRVPR